MYAWKFLIILLAMLAFNTHSLFSQDKDKELDELHAGWAACPQEFLLEKRMQNQQFKFRHQAIERDIFLRADQRHYHP